MNNGKILIISLEKINLILKNMTGKMKYREKKLMIFIKNKKSLNIEEWCKNKNLENKKK